MLRQIYTESSCKAHTEDIQLICQQLKRNTIIKNKTEARNKQKKDTAQCTHYGSATKLKERTQCTHIDLLTTTTVIMGVFNYCDLIVKLLPDRKKNEKFTIHIFLIAF